MKEAAAETESLAVGALSAAAAELSSKAAQFDGHLLNVLLEHLEHEERRVQLLHQESDQCTNIITKHKAELDLLRVMDRPLNSVLDAAEHKHLCQTSSSADAALAACAGFARDFGPFLSKNDAAQARLQKLEADHAEVIRKLKLCRELLGLGSARTQGHASPTKAQTQASTSTAYLGNATHVAATAAPPAPLLTAAVAAPAAAAIAATVPAASVLAESGSAEQLQQQVQSQLQTQLHTAPASQAQLETQPATTLQEAARLQPQQAQAPEELKSQSGEPLDAAAAAAQH